MLYGYPITATTENWLHDCLYEVIQLVHTSLQTSQALPDWPDIIPEKYRNRLRKRTGLRDRLKTYQTAVESLAQSQRDQVYQALVDQNAIAHLLSCAHNCESINDLPQSIREPVKDLFSFSFDLLTDLEIRDNQYRKIFEAVQNVCPFCGCESFDAPMPRRKIDISSERREALDHYLAASKYPFAAANLRNLVPMGHKCNSSYKLAQDILYNDDGSRRKSFDPYNHVGIKVCLDNSQPFAGTDGKMPQWRIEFDPATEETITWDIVFEIRERYKKNILDLHFNRWLEEFSIWCKQGKFIIQSDQDLINAIDSYAIYHEFVGIHDRSFLKAAVFRMLQKHCQLGDTRLILLIKDVINGIIG